MNEGHYIFDIDNAEWWDGEGSFSDDADKAACYSKKSEAVKQLLLSGRESAQLLYIADLGTFHEFAESA